MTNPILISYQQSDLIGKIIFLLLFAASVTTWTFFIKKWLQIKEIRREGFSLRDFVSKKMLNPMQFDPKKRETFFYSFFSVLQTSVEPFFQKKEETESLTAKELEKIEEALFLTATERVKQIEKNMFVLSTIVTLAPFLGLLGTVWGILITFLDLQTSGGQRAEGVMMGGLAMALATTVVGLVVAIPALVSYNYLRSQLALLRHEVHCFGQTLIHNLGHFYCNHE